MKLTTMLLLSVLVPFQAWAVCSSYTNMAAITSNKYSSGTIEKFSPGRITYSGGYCVLNHKIYFSTVTVNGAAASCQSGEFSNAFAIASEAQCLAISKDLLKVALLAQLTGRKISGCVGSELVLGPYSACDVKLLEISE